GSFLERNQSLFELAIFAQQLPAMHVGGSRQEPSAVDRAFVADVGGLQVKGLAEKLVGHFVVLAGLRGFALFVELLGLICECGCGEQYEEGKNQRCSPFEATHWTPWSGRVAALVHK